MANRHYENARDFFKYLILGRTLPIENIMDEMVVKTNEIVIKTKQLEELARNYQSERQEVSKKL